MKIYKMKKILLLMCFIVLGANLFAQDLKVALLFDGKVFLIRSYTIITTEYDSRISEFEITISAFEAFLQQLVG